MRPSSARIRVHAERRGCAWVLSRMASAMRHLGVSPGATVRVRLTRVCEAGGGQGSAGQGAHVVLELAGGEGGEAGVSAPGPASVGAVADQGLLSGAGTDDEGGDGAAGVVAQRHSCRIRNGSLHLLAKAAAALLPEKQQGIPVIVHVRAAAVAGACASDGVPPAALQPLQAHTLTLRGDPSWWRLTGAAPLQRALGVAEGGRVWLSRREDSSLMAEAQEGKTKLAARPVGAGKGPLLLRCFPSSIYVPLRTLKALWPDTEAGARVGVQLCTDNDTGGDCRASRSASGIPEAPLLQQHSLTLRATTGGDWRITGSSSVARALGITWEPGSGGVPLEVVRLPDGQLLVRRAEERLLLTCYRHRIRVPLRTLRALWPEAAGTDGALGQDSGGGTSSGSRVQLYTAVGDGPLGPVAGLPEGVQLQEHSAKLLYEAARCAWRLSSCTAIARAVGVTKTGGGVPLEAVRLPDGRLLVRRAEEGGGGEHQAQQQQEQLQSGQGAIEAERDKVHAGQEGKGFEAWEASETGEVESEEGDEEEDKGFAEVEPGDEAVVAKVPGLHAEAQPPGTPQAQPQPVLHTASPSSCRPRKGESGAGMGSGAAACDRASGGARADASVGTKAGKRQLSSANTDAPKLQSHLHQPQLPACHMSGGPHIASGGTTDADARRRSGSGSSEGLDPAAPGSEGSPRADVRQGGAGLKRGVELRELAAQPGPGPQGPATPKRPRPGGGWQPLGVLQPSRRCGPEPAAEGAVKATGGLNSPPAAPAVPAQPAAPAVPAPEGTDQGRQQQQPGPAAAATAATAPCSAHLPVSSLSPRHLLGAVPPSVGLPPLQPGEMRLCGLTYHPVRARAERQAMADWEAGLGPEGLAGADPAGQQIRLGLDAALVKSYRLRPLVLADYLAKLLGLAADWAAPLPPGPLELQGVEAAAAEGGGRCRGGMRLLARRAFRRSHPLGVVGGYVLPCAAAEELVCRGFQRCGPGAAAELEARAGGVEDRANAWRMLARSHLLPLQGLGAGGEGGAVLWMLGYGNLGALVNDPRANPRAWEEGNDVEPEGQGQGEGQAEGQGQGEEDGRLHPGANCAVRTGLQGGVTVVLTCNTMACLLQRVVGPGVASDMDCTASIGGGAITVQCARFCIVTSMTHGHPVMCSNSGRSERKPRHCWTEPCLDGGRASMDTA